MLFIADKKTALTIKYSYDTVTELAEHLNACIKFNMITVNTKKRNVAPDEAPSQRFEIQKDEITLLTVSKDSKTEILSENILPEMLPYLDRIVVKEYLAEHLKN